MKFRSYPDVKTLETIARRSSQGKNFWPSISDTDLEVSVCILLLEDNADSLFDVDEEPPRSRGLVIVAHAPTTVVRFFLEGGASHWVVTVQVGLDVERIDQQNMYER